MNSPAITVLGGRGFIGSHLVRHFQAQGYSCFVPEKGADDLFSRPLGHVVYAAGLTADFRARPLDTVEAHVCLLRRLLQEADFESLTYLSSTRVYAGISDTRETATLHVNPGEPSDLYNLSKLTGESLCLHGGRAGVKIARLSNIIGLRRDADIFIDQLLEEGCRTGKVEFRTSLDSRKDYLYIDDAVDVLSRMTVSPETGIFNVASGEGVANSDIAAALGTEMGFEVSVAPGAPSWHFTEIDISKVKRLFGFSPQKFGAYFPTYLQSYRQKKDIV